MKTYPWEPRTWGTRNFVGEFGKDGLGFFAGEAGDVGDGVFVGEGVLGNVGGMDGEREAGLGEEFAAAGGCGGEDEHREIIAGVAS
jgi:hypothetical protein